MFIMEIIHASREPYSDDFDREISTLDTPAGHDRNRTQIQIISEEFALKARERVRITMSNGKADRVPVIPQICIPHAVKMLGMDYEETLLDVIRHPERENDITYRCAKAYGVDGMRAWMTGDPFDVVNVDGTWMGRDPQTGEITGRVDFEGGGGVAAAGEPVIHTIEDIDAIPVPAVGEVLKGGRLDSIKEVLDKAGDDLLVISGPGAFTFEYITSKRGKMQALMDIMDEPDFCHRMLQKATACAINNALALASIGVEALYIGDTFGGVMSPSQFDEFCVPYIKQFVKAVKGSGPLIYLHICGDSRRILEKMADTGVDCIEPLDPLGGVEVKDAKKRVGDKVALMGGVHNVKLAHGTLQEVVDDCQRCLSQGAPGGGYILACGDMLPTETSKEKVEAMVEAACNYTY